MFIIIPILNNVFLTDDIIDIIKKLIESGHKINILCKPNDYNDFFIKFPSCRINTLYKTETISNETIINYVNTFIFSKTSIAQACAISTELLASTNYDSLITLLNKVKISKYTYIEYIKYIELFLYLKKTEQNNYFEQSYIYSNKDIKKFNIKNMIKNI